MSVTYVSSLILNTIICCLVSIPYKQCNSTKAGMQHSHLCNPPPSRLFESVWGTWIQQLCSHQRWCPGFWQTEAVHLCVSTLPDKRYVVTGYNRLQVKDGWSLLIWKMKSIKSSLKSAFFLIASRVQLFWLHKRYTVCIIKSMLKTFSSPDVPSDWFKVSYLQIHVWNLGLHWPVRGYVRLYMDSMLCTSFTAELIGDWAENKV